MALEVGQRVGDYEVLALLGAGGMGCVYKVRNIISNREEAMKILLPDFAFEPELAARFMTEIRTLASLEHPNIAQLRTAFQFQSQFVMIMEIVEGTTLETLASQTVVSIDKVLEYSTQALSALSYAHSHGVTHRDIKPANIMITSHGLVKLMDFGIAKSTNDMQLTRPGTTMGSVYYMSPEQVRGGTVDARSDIYSFGVTLYEMLTGRKPFQADTSYSVLNAQLNQAPMPPVQINPALSPELNNIILRAMVKNPNGRFQTADEFRNALKNLREPLTQTQPTPSQQQYQPVAAAPQGFTPAATQVAGGAWTPAPPAPPAPAPAASSPGKNHRGLWIGLGAVAALLALVAAATLLPHVFPTKASPKTGATSSDVVNSGSANTTKHASEASTDQQPNLLNQSAIPEGQKALVTPTQKAIAGVTAKNRAMEAAAGKKQSDTPVPPPPMAGPSPQEIRQAHDRLMNLDARADAARGGVDSIRRQQQAQGFDMRGDIVAAMNRMNSSLSEANRALSQNDLQAANDYMDRADKEVGTLETFLGR